jgi:hypothetical protein
MEALAELESSSAIVPNVAQSLQLSIDIPTGAGNFFPSIPGILIGVRGEVIDGCGGIEGVLMVVAVN